VPNDEAMKHLSNRSVGKNHEERKGSLVMCYELTGEFQIIEQKHINEKRGP